MQPKATDEAFLSFKRSKDGKRQGHFNQSKHARKKKTIVSVSDILFDCQCSFSRIPFLWQLLFTFVNGQTSYTVDDTKYLCFSSNSRHTYDDAVCQIHELVLSQIW